MSVLQSIPPFLYISLVALGVMLGTVAYLILLERKVASWIQDRIGPNRAGPRGLLQPVADGLKMFVKEDYTPSRVDRVLFSIAPASMMLVVIVAMAVIPWAGLRQASAVVSITNTTAQEAALSILPRGAKIVRIDYLPTPPDRAMVTYQYPFQIARLNIGVVFLLAVLSLAVYSVVMGGWASNNKYSLLGGLRAAAQMISYEIPLGLSLLSVLVLGGSFELGQIVNRQARCWAGFLPAWNVFAQPLAFVTFLVCLHAEANRSPFDLAEAEQELVGGYHTEYSSMRLGLLLLSEYAEMLVTSSVCVALFFGGWHLPGLNGPDPANPAVTSSLGLILLRCLVYFMKVLLLIFVFMWVRWSLPRFRFDQLMKLAWRGMIPVSLAVLLATALVLYWLGPADRTFREGLGISGLTALAMLGANIAVALASVGISRVLPASAPVNRRIRVADSRFNPAGLPAQSA